MKKPNYFYALILSILLLSVLGCASTADSASTGEYIDDTVITSKVKAEIFKEESLKSFDIHVETFKGVVQLSGFVDSDAQQTKAAMVASKVGGVKSVSNDIKLK